MVGLTGVEGIWHQRKIVQSINNPIMKQTYEPANTHETEIITLWVQFTGRLGRSNIARAWFLASIGGGSAAIEKHMVDRVAA